MQRQNPFSIYDFLGYFVPGAIFLYAIRMIVSHANPKSEILTGSFFALDTGEAYLPFLLAAYTIGHMLSFLSSITIERYSIWALGYPSKSLLGFESPAYLQGVETDRQGKFIRILIWMICLPVSLSDRFLGRVLRLRDFYASSLDGLLRGVIITKLASLLVEKAELGSPESIPNVTAANFFSYAYHYGVENAPNHFPKMQNYVALYGFLRTLTFIGVVGFWIVLVHCFTRTMNYPSMVLWLWAMTFVTYTLFMGFQKFYRRFSLEVLMALAVSYPQKVRSAS